MRIARSLYALACWSLGAAYAEGRGVEADPEQARALMQRVWPAAVARVREEVRDMQALARAEGQNITIEPWDYRYYMEKIRQDRYQLSQDELKPYFQLDRIIDANGRQDCAGLVFNIDVMCRTR